MRIDIYGDLDQLNSLIGFSLVVLKGEFDDIHQTLTQIQKDLFVMGSNMACEEAKRVEYKLPQLTSESITDIEKAIDKLDGALPILKSFILPSGSEGSTRLHLCRTFTRNLERKLADFDKNIEQSPDNYLIF